ncbi:MAG: branched-chain amino acid transaminase [Bacteroidetes bacterium]|nr:branched-chain amino acid transaminase [Rhodothermia bacterium]MCS7154243.1 branched-chain amino acid transaminase [Bacteroidota bacterium]MCX7906721.1 branched-chain amino acid transaminase [Bacteroidota bacterium]MDW8136999.1 branched-chain amino acid transaminase [Bacteroidota bacterium]MDW8285130.1 branched-chain amino acid transaminase [Bacteroidota bacterium]
MEPLCEWIWFNGRLVPFEEARVHVLAHVIHYGSSVFEGIRAYKTKKGTAIFRLREHLRRLYDSAKIYRMSIPYTPEELEEAVLQSIRANGLESCYIRPIVFRGYGPMGVNPLHCPVEVAIAVWEWGAYLGQEALEQGVDVQVSSWNRLPANSIPYIAKAGGNYLNSQLIKMEALTNGYAEGIALDYDGFIAEGSGENLFLVRDGRLFTPSLEAPILPGVTRDAVIRLARDMGLEVVETRLPRSSLYVADELFFTGTAAEITPIRSVDRIPIGTGFRGPITARLQEAFFHIVHDGEDPYGWLTPVYSRELV